VLVSLRTIFPLSTSATNRSTENTLRVERNATHLPSGLIAGPTFKSAARPFPSTTRRPIWLGGVVTANVGSYALRIAACQSSDNSLVLMPSTRSIATSGSPVAAPSVSMRRITSSP
jgi:hypothetical protein